MKSVTYGDHGDLNAVTRSWKRIGYTKYKSISRAVLRLFDHPQPRYKVLRAIKMKLMHISQTSTSYLGSGSTPQSRFAQHFATLSRLAEIQDIDEADGYVSTKAVLDAHDIVFDVLHKARLLNTAEWLRKLQGVDQHPQRRLRIRKYIQLVEQVDLDRKDMEEIEKPEALSKIKRWLEKFV